MNEQRKKIASYKQCHISQKISFTISLLTISLYSFAQLDAIADKNYTGDSLRVNSYMLTLSSSFYFSDNEMNSHMDFRFVNAVHFSYLFKYSDIEATCRQILDRESSGEFYFNHFVFLSHGFMKYKPLRKNKAKIRKAYLEPIFIFQNNSDRGLQYRFQPGLLFHPWSLAKTKIKLNIAFGGVYTWDSWSVNDKAAIAELDQERQEMIRFINSHITLRKNMYQDYSEFRPMLLLNFNWQATEILQIGTNILYQQSLRSPYNAEIKKAYPELAKVYPYLLAELILNVKVHKAIELKLTAEVDYENSNLSISKSSWTYMMMFGGSFSFSNQKSK